MKPQPSKEYATSVLLFIEALLAQQPNETKYLYGGSFCTEEKMLSVELPNYQLGRAQYWNFGGKYRLQMWEKFWKTPTVYTYWMVEDMETGSR